MPLVKYIEDVAQACIAGSAKNTAIVASSPWAIISWLEERFDPQKHDAALMVRFKDSEWVYFAISPNEIPFCDLYDPHTGRFLIKYYEDPEEWDAVIHITGVTNEEE